MSTEFLRLRNGQAASRGNCPVVSTNEFSEAVIDAVAFGARLSAMPAWPAGDGAVRVTAVLSQPKEGGLDLIATDIRDSYPSLTPDCPQAHWFERELAEQWCLRPDGHPWLKPIRFVGRAARCSRNEKDGPGLREQPGFAEATPGLRQVVRPTIGVTDFFHMEGEEVHEVAVGPVHAGVIEPGHFRFQCQGETVHHLEISLGYQHRGVERAMIGGPSTRTLHYAQTLAGDTTIGHTTAYCTVLEALAGAPALARAEALRAVAAELERIANHVGDLGALAGDVGFLPTMSYCGRIRGDVLNLTALLCGNRFGRGMVVPGGVAWDADEAIIAQALDRLEAISRDATSAIELLFESPSVLARFEGTGRLEEELARRIGLVGPAARACGIPCDVRAELPYGIHRFSQMSVCTWPSGDCFARAYVRWLEILQSLAFIREQLRGMPVSPVRHDLGPLRDNALAVTLVEGWRGEICHFAVTDQAGRLAAYKVVDPSFHNWFGLACALREQQISDFPLCNKSFNLSYCGHDL